VLLINNIILLEKAILSGVKIYRLSRRLTSAVGIKRPKTREIFPSRESGSKYPSITFVLLWYLSYYLTGMSKSH